MTSAAKRPIASTTSSTPAQLTGMIWVANRNRMRHSTPRTPGKMRPGWLISAPRPARAPRSSRNRISGRAIADRIACRQSILTSTVFWPARCRVDRRPVEALHLAPVELGQQVRDVLRDEVDQLQLEGLLLGEGLALDDGLLGHLHVAAAALRLAPDVGGGVRGDLLRHDLVHLAEAGHGVGGADVGAGRHRRDVRGLDDDEARPRPRGPPTGPTNTATGVRQFSMRSMICRIELSSPPGVSIRTTTSGAPEASARSIACTTWAAVTAWTTPSSSTTGMSARAAAADPKAKAATAAVSHLAGMGQL